MKRGEVYRVALDPAVGAEKQKTRPCIVVRRNMVDDASEARNPLTIVVPLNDANGRSGNLLNVFLPAGVAGATKTSLAVCSQVRALDKRRFVGRKLGEVPADTMRLIDRACASFSRWTSSSGFQPPVRTKLFQYHTPHAPTRADQTIRMTPQFGSRARTPMHISANRYGKKSSAWRMPNCTQPLR